jgi:hypothetical protein
MAVIAVFLGFVLIGDAIAVVIAAAVEHFNKFASLLVFLGLFVAVFCVAWVLAVHATERYLVRPDERPNHRRDKVNFVSSGYAARA